MIKVIKFLAIIIVAIAIRVYGKSSSHDDIKEQLTTACQGRETCLEAVNEKYDGCFDNAYTIGRHSRFDQDQFTACMAK